MHSTYAGVGTGASIMGASVNIIEQGRTLNAGTHTHTRIDADLHLTGPRLAMGMESPHMGPYGVGLGTVACRRGGMPDDQHLTVVLHGRLVEIQSLWKQEQGSIQIYRPRGI